MSRRLREYFPETLVWQPELTTDAKGRAELNFKLADNITTWKLAVIGSTENGEVGVAETEIRTFQPFFAELDPPQILTQGDEVALPVVLRNYLNTKQIVDLQFKQEDWFTILNRPRKQVEIPAGESSTEIFDIQATSSIKSGRQRVTALGSEFSDAIEKSIKVHPDGEEKTTTASDFLASGSTMSLELPPETIDKSAHVELKVYPNLLSHVWESVEGIMERPYGCGEQTISSTYPSLLVLMHLKQQDHNGPLAEKARRYLAEGYARLLGYQSADGGFTYWGRGQSDIALTAYALRFLVDAAKLMDVNERVIERAHDWLSKQQRSDGSWSSSHSGDVAMLTAVAARSLSGSAPCKNNVKTGEKTQVEKALDYLDRRRSETDEPYLIASYSIAASSGCDSVRAAAANMRLKKLVHLAPTGNYWALDANTPFYGWGRTGRIETTALAVEALSRPRSENAPDAEVNKLIDGALLFLLREKDRYGVWHSTQATINVLNCLLTLLTSQTAAEKTTADKLDVLVNNQPVKSLELPVRQQMVAPIIVDISSAVRTGTNTIELKRSSAGAVASVQVVGTYWVPWQLSTETSASESKSLRFQHKCDKTAVRVMEEITCRVKAERLDTRGRGMLVAEIGLPPGADVDRASLDAAMKSETWTIDRYDVLPNRIVVYLWPRTGGGEFHFKFRPRLAMNAQSAASVAYDYYNPDARATVPPIRFVVR